MTVEFTLCPCFERLAEDCPGEWEPGCDLGNNPKYVTVHDEQEQIAELVNKMFDAVVNQNVQGSAWRKENKKLYKAMLDLKEYLERNL